MNNDDNPYRSPEAAVPITQSKAADADDPSSQPALKMEKLDSYLNLSDAQLCQAMLRQNGIDSYLENEGSVGVNWLWSNAVGGVKLFVESQHLNAARELLAEGEVASEPIGIAAPIDFACEECGKEVSFPGDRRGKVETCPKCHEYIDVPD